MPFDHETPFDHALLARPGANTSEEQPFRRLVRRKQTRRRFRRNFADTCFLLIRGGAFAASTLAITLGLPLGFFLALSGWNLEVLFGQLDNLATHYLAADPERRAAFAGLIEVAFPGLFGLIAIWRLPRFVEDVATGLACGSDEA